MPNVNINGLDLQAEDGATILEAARFIGFPIPTLCHMDGLTPYGACRLCVVEIGPKDKAKLVSSCTYPVEDGLIVRTPHLDDATNNEIIAALEAKIAQPITIVRFDSVGPTVGREVTTRATGAVAIASLAIMMYIWYAFRGVPNAYRYGVSAIIAMLHDVSVVFGVQAILSHFLGWEVDSLFLTALLTVIGFSVHDSIVVFDRIRENARKHRRQPFETVVGMSIDQTLVRSINTQLTVFLTLLALAIFGGSTIRHFVVILMVGVLSGTYSSIFNAAPILVVWENREWQHWFRRSPQAAT